MSENAFLWSNTAASNASADSAVPWPEGMSPGAVNDAARSLMAGVSRLIRDLNGTVATTGSANAYLITSNSGHTTLVNGALITARASFSNTAAATLNFNSFGAKNIRVFDSSGERAVAASQIQSGGTYQFRYDSAADSASGAWILLNPSPDPTALLGPGDIKFWDTNTLPSGWLWCDGSIPLIATYPALYAVIGTRHGGDGITTFALPDLRGRAVFGKDDMGGTAASRITTAGSSIDGTILATAGGAQNVTLSTAQLPSITPAGTVTAAGTVTNSGSGTSSYTPAGGLVFTSSGTNSYTPTGSNTKPAITVTNGGNVVQATGATLNLTASGALGIGINSVTAALNNAPVFNGDTDTLSFSGTARTFSFTNSGSSFLGTPFGGDGAHTNIPPAFILNFIIKT